MPSARALARLGEVLVRDQVIDSTQLRSALAHQEQWGGRLPRLVAELGFADEDIVTEHLAAALRFPLVHLGHGLKDMAALRTLDAGFCEQHAVFPVSLRDRVLTLAMADPTEVDVVDEVQHRAGVRLLVQMASETEISNAIRRHYRGQSVEHASTRALDAVHRLDQLAHDEGVDGSLQLDSRPSGEKEFPAFVPLAPDEHSELDDDDLSRLEVARLNQTKVRTITRVVNELLIEKGVFPR